MSRLSELKNSKQDLHTRMSTRIPEEKGGFKRPNGKAPEKIPVFDMHGNPYQPEKDKRRKRIRIISVVLAVLLMFIYVPQIFIKPETLNVTVDKDATAIRRCNEILQSNTQEDWDEDGIANADESKYGTDVYNPDTDGDGIYDLYEVNVSKTDPLKYNDDILIDAQTKLDEEMQKSIGSPYKIGNVILWPDDYHSKAHGSVVETVRGYRFTDFSGYANFAAYGTCFAYKYEDGVRTLLPYHANENAWRISAGDTVEVYENELLSVFELGLFGEKFYMDSNGFTNIVATLLPDEGFVTGCIKMQIDVEPDTSDNVTTEIRKPSYYSDSPYRFTVNTNTLNNLQFVRQTIKENQDCVAVSLYSRDYGEWIGIIYGYTVNGDLLIADEATLAPIGVIEVKEQSKKVIDQYGEMLVLSYFDFKGFDFDSAKGDKICFFAISGNGSNFAEEMEAPVTEKEDISSEEGFVEEEEASSSGKKSDTKDGTSEKQENTTENETPIDTANVESMPDELFEEMGEG